MSIKSYDGEPLRMVSTSPQRPRHQIKRSASELSSPIKLPRHHHLHRRRERDRDDRSSLPANPVINLPRGSLDLPRSEGVTPGATTDTSRRTDMFLPGAEDAANYAGASTAQQPSRSKEEQVQSQRQRQRRKPTSSAAGLQNSLAELSTFSNATMRRLDDTYYSVLERLSMLQSTIVAIKDLASMSQDVNESFSEESNGLVSEIESQINSVDQFDDQQKRIQVLQDRIYAGREKAQALSRRVDVVRERIEGWERADREWQERTRKRLKVLWLIISAMAFVMMLVFFGAQFSPSSADVSVVPRIGSGGREGNPPMNEMVGNQSKSAADVTDEVREVLHQRRGDNQGEEKAPRVFEEL
ncbi:hypothetical protein F5X99DRAFT_387597 [Biscogniauxia marginata]|nr:hypothetical protein F5X99DRAFT_387597 [Biscogniauxia marginata]